MQIEKKITLFKAEDIIFEPLKKYIPEFGFNQVRKEIRLLQKDMTKLANILSKARYLASEEKKVLK